MPDLGSSQSFPPPRFSSSLQGWSSQLCYSYTINYLMESIHSLIRSKWPCPAPDQLQIWWGWSNRQRARPISMSNPWSCLFPHNEWRVTQTAAKMICSCIFADVYGWKRKKKADVFKLYSTVLIFNAVNSLKAFLVLEWKCFLSSWMQTFSKENF